MTRLVGLASFLFVLSVAQFAYTINAPLIWDSHIIVQEDETIRSLANIPSFFLENSSPERPYSGKSLGERLQYYRPVLKSVLAIEYALWKDNSTGYHLTSCLLNAFVVVLFFWLVWAIQGEERIAFLASLLYAVNPSRGEAVNWVYSLSTPLMAFFVLAALLAYRYRKYFLSVLAFSVALLCREEAILLLPLLFVYEYVFQADDGWARCLRRVGPFLLVTVGFLLLRQQIVGLPPVAVEPSLNLFNTIAVIVARALKIIVVPDAPVAHYLLRDFSQITTQVLVAYAVSGVCLVMLAYLWRAERRLFFWCLWGFVWFSLSLNVGGAGQYLMTEKMMYLASGGFCVVFVAYLQKWRYGLPLIILLAVLHFGVTFTRSTYWKDEVSHLRAVLDFAPDHNIGRTQLATVLMKRGEFKEAVPLYQKLLEVNPDNVIALNNLGLCFYELGQYEEAKKAWSRAFSLEPESINPAYNLGLLAEREGDYAAALEYFSYCYAQVPSPPEKLLSRIKRLQRLVEEGSGGRGLTTPPPTQGSAD